MKKIVLTSLFSATLFVGAFGTVAFAEEVVPMDPSTPPIEVPTDPSTPVTPTEPTTPVESPVDPITPPVTPSEPTVPVEPEQPTEPSQPTVPSEPTEPVNPTEPSQPTLPSEPTEPTKPTEPSTSPSTSEEPTKPVEKPKEEATVKPSTPKPVEPAKEVTVTVTPSGQVTPNKSQGTRVPIVTSNVDELTHIPTPTTPLKVATGQAIVGVLDGVPLVKNDQGELVKDSSIPVKKLPSGNIEVKTADGKTKVLPKTGEETRTVLSVLGLIFVIIASFFGYKKTKVFL